jgi:DNA-directed RNA polymerase specialized sigma24 family protein
VDVASDPAQRAADSLLSGASPSSDDFNALRGMVIGYLRAAWPSLSESDAEDAADEALVRVLVRQREHPGQGQETRNGLGYVLRTARNLQVDRFRRRREHPDGVLHERTEGPGMEDREILRLIDNAASLSSINQALDRAVTLGDTRVETVVSAWLDLAEQTGAPPSTRDVAATLGVAHTTVQRALSRFHGHLKAVLGETSP